MNFERFPCWNFVNRVKDLSCNVNLCRGAIFVLENVKIVLEMRNWLISGENAQNIAFWLI